MLYRSTDRLCRCGAPMQNLAHSASFDSEDKDAPSKPGIKHLVRTKSPAPGTRKHVFRVAELFGMALGDSCHARLGRLHRPKCAADRADWLGRDAVRLGKVVGFGIERRGQLQRLAAIATGAVAMWQPWLVSTGQCGGAGVRVLPIRSSMSGCDGRTTDLLRATVLQSILHRPDIIVAMTMAGRRRVPVSWRSRRRARKPGRPCSACHSFWRSTAEGRKEKWISNVVRQCADDSLKPEIVERFVETIGASPRSSSPSRQTEGLPDTSSPHTGR